eukprot:6212850-Pleurochrysis_carterae.AAC.1
MRKVSTCQKGKLARRGWRRKLAVRDDLLKARASASMPGEAQLGHLCAALRCTAHKFQFKRAYTA